jgi:hypothetical protein
LKTGGTDERENAKPYAYSRFQRDPHLHVAVALRLMQSPQLTGPVDTFPIFTLGHFPSEAHQVEGSVAVRLGETGGDPNSEIPDGGVSRFRVTLGVVMKRLADRMRRVDLGTQNQEALSA